MKIAIIDTGIDRFHPKLKHAAISGVSIYNQDGVWESGYDFSDHIGHGTACASIIHKHIPEAKLFAIKIYKEDYIVREDSLIEALKWIDSNPEIKIVNISLGVSGMANPKLSEICQQLQAKGVIIVASCNNDISKKDFPAAFPSVIGVLAGQIKKSKEYGITYDGYFIAKGSIQRVAWAGGTELMVTGTSYATPHLSGIIACLLQEYPKLSFEQIRTKLTKTANDQIFPMQFMTRTSYYKKPTLLNEFDTEKVRNEFTAKHKFNWINKIAIFPISEKEMKQFTDFPYLSSFEIALEIDYPRTLSSFHINNDKNTLRNIPSDEEFERFDTLIVGYYLDSLWEGNIVFGNSLIDEALKRNKNFFLYDKRVVKYIEKRIKELQIKHLPHIYTPEVRVTDYELYSSFEFLPQVNCPVLMVIGTGNRQGKFTTQLRIIDILNKEGYRTGFVSTEPHGELFGANYVFPIGYMRNVNLRSIEFVPFLRNIYRGISYFIKPHIIVTGTQGAFMPYNVLSTSPLMGAVESVGYVYGVLPDIIVCAINPNDWIEAIKKNTLIAKLYSKSQIAFYVITPWEKTENGGSRRLSDEELKERINFYQQELKLPVIDIMKDDNNSFVLDRIETLCT
jgi:uncharacterized NAD-dependent epimerase/dehydratase family protein